MCEAFGCEPWIAVYVETRDLADLFMTSLINYDAKYRITKDKAIDDWKMSPRWMRAYEEDSEVMHLRVRFEPGHWFGQQVEWNVQTGDKK